jgi:hypothetical protein
MQVYAYKAKDAALVREVVGIRKLARRAHEGSPEGERGRLRRPSSKKLGRAKTQLTRLRRSPSKGIDKHLADRARKAAAMTEKQFEAAIDLMDKLRKAGMLDRAAGRQKTGFSKNPVLRRAQRPNDPRNLGLPVRQKAFAGQSRRGRRFANASF